LKAGDKIKDQKTKDKFIEMRAQGLSFNKIAKELKVSKPTLIKWSREFEMQISNLKALELETLYEKHYVTKKKRVTLLGETLDKIKEELSKRDLSKIPDAKLFDLIIKYLTYTKNEETEISFQDIIEVEDSFGEKMKSKKKWKG